MSASDAEANWLGVSKKKRMHVYTCISPQLYMYVIYISIGDLERDVCV